LALKFQAEGAARLPVCLAKNKWYVKLAQLKVQLLNEEDRREKTLLGGRRERSV
jgi:hypothetical protein